ncbi:MAG: hypothetical protein OXC44_07310 [Proteobacteria bacterium]|nr:hypothetical protein [Pseudomonadota bacterium]
MDRNNKSTLSDHGPREVFEPSAYSLKGMNKAYLYYMTAESNADKEGYFVLCLRYSSVGDNTCGNPFVILSEDRANMKSLRMSFDDEQLLKTATQYFANNDHRKNEDLEHAFRWRNYFPKSVSYLSIRDIRKMETIYHFYLKDRHNLILDKIVNHKEYHNIRVARDVVATEDNIMMALDNLRTFLSYMIGIDYNSIDYCYPYFDKDSNSPRYTKDMLRCAIGGEMVNQQ